MAVKRKTIKRKFFGLKCAGAALIAGCILAGCNRPLPETGGVEAGVPVQKAEWNAGAAAAELPAFSSKPSEPAGNTDEGLPKVSEPDKELFDGSDMELWDGGNGRLMALKEDTLYLYDVADAKVLAKGKTESWFLPYFYPCKDGFCIIGSPEDDLEDAGKGEDESNFRVIESVNDWDCLAVFYDNTLQEKKRLLLNDITPYPDATLWCVSPDGASLVYFNIWEGLCIYDCDKAARRQILDFSGPGENVSGLLAIDALFFDEERDRLVFTGGSAKGGVTVESWGTVNLDGTGFENHILEKNAGIAVAYKGGKLLLGEDSLTFEKIMGYVDTLTGEETYSTDLGGGLGIGGPVFSDAGETFAVTDITEGQAVVTVYNTADFSKICREVITDEREEYFYRSPRVYLFDGLKVCLVCMGGQDVPLKSFFIRY